eukprot:EG_transcript_5044
MGGRFGLQSLLRFDRFANAELEARFQQEYRQPTVDACNLWATVEAVVVLTNICGAVAFRQLSVSFWALCSVHICCAVAILCLARSSSHFKVPFLKDILCACYCLCLAAFGAQQCVGLRYYQDLRWGLPGLTADVLVIVNGCMSYLFLIYFYIFQQLLTLPLLQIGFCPASLTSVLCGPTVYILMATVGVSLQLVSFTFLPIIVLIVGVQAFYCRRLAVLRRSVFLLELQKARHAQETREADAAINHIVKNMMAEAAGLTEVFLDVCVPPPPEALVNPYLRCALERLRRGMAWCRRRGVLLELLDTEAKPARTPTALKALGMALVSQRNVTTDFADVEVELDEALTDLLMENAINNAFRHGHPTDPAVHFAITVDLLDPADGACAVTFRVTNRSDPSRQPLALDVLEELRRPWSPSPSRPAPVCQGLGLRHCLLAAELQSMTVSLVQEGDLVVFLATVVTNVVSRPPPPATPTPPAAPVCATPLPRGVRIAVIDDSAAARSLLCHQLRHDIPESVVDVFGASAEDVEPFLNHTLATADIAILDQHLDWPSGDPGLGTDLVQGLLQAGFQGMLCIRSANMSEPDMQHYFACGAHCVLDKLLDRAQMTATLAHHYWHFFARPRDRRVSTHWGTTSQVVALPGLVPVP